ALTGPVVGGYRVLINGVGLNDFAGEDNKIAVRNSGNTAWSFVTASANWAVFDKQSDNGYTFNADGPA
ncbi:hypothetical protein WHJ47_14410, partial [Staphylococcus aureus]|uniref:hypothetical protein n=1 Tax=Staphylococcus aureus TaxID=1280 RepID=UPI0039BE1FE3